ncbi:Disease resistance protein RFL1 [Vitis vinifera]|uniref:Disease resistance protein RFL1 n=1 Tax=Vitis vinifera TaxID=29760 RepID=A0A438G386_VITVI|nr:Disease resistance protein RFL1 [Vitis vinifera]
MDRSRMWKKDEQDLACESLGVVDPERVIKWKEAERISLWGRNIEKLPETPHCSNLQTLFVRECIQLKAFPRGFFQFMSRIRVLDLSATHCLTKLPDGIEGLVHLEYINLSMTYTLVMFNCPQLEEMKINVEKEGSKGFEQSYGIPNPELIVRNNQHFRRHRDVKIWSCPKLLNLTWLIYAAHLQSLNVQFCESMKEVISNECNFKYTARQHIHKAHISSIRWYANAKEHLSGGTTLPSLEIISVIDCPKLRRLPIDSISAAKSLKKIEGDLTWWGRLEWEDESVEENFTNYFSPQYLADPIQDSGEVKGKMKLVVEGSTSREPPKHSLSIAEVITHGGTGTTDSLSSNY